MLSLKLDVANGNDKDGDGMPAASVMRTDYVQDTEHISFAGWKQSDGHEVPMIKHDPNGRAILVTKASSIIAQSEYENIFSEKKIWH